MLLQLPPKSRWGIVAESGCVWPTHGDPSKCMSLRENCASRRGHHYVEAWPEPSTSFYVEHLRLLRLSGESNPGPPALQASTLWKEPFERPYLVAIRDLTCVATTGAMYEVAFATLCTLWFRLLNYKPCSTVDNGAMNFMAVLPICFQIANRKTRRCSKS